LFIKSQNFWISKISNFEPKSQVTYLDEIFTNLNKSWTYMMPKDYLMNLQHNIQV